MRRASLLALLLGVLVVAAPFSRPALAADVEDEDEDEYEDADRAHLIVRKSTPQELVVEGRKLNITIAIHNAGPVSAKKIQIKDTLPPGATLVDGSLEAEFPVLSSGSSVEHTYVMQFVSGGSGLALPHATVTYQAEDSATQVGYSSTMGVFVMTPIQQITRWALIGGSYVSLGLCRQPTDWRNVLIVAVVAGVVLGGNAMMKSASSASTSRKRQRALQELEKTE